MSIDLNAPVLLMNQWLAGVCLQGKLLLPLLRVGEGPAMPPKHPPLKHFFPVQAGTSQASNVQV